MAQTSARREAISLALGLWTLETIAQLLFTLAIGAQAFLYAYPFLWAVHGLLLTLVLMLVVERCQLWSPVRKWLAIGAVLVILTLIQTWLDEKSSFLLTRILRGVFDIPPFGAAIMFDYGPGVREIGFEISSMIYLGVFGCYAVALNLIQAQDHAARSEAAAVQAELLASRFQLNPHLLFNALNSVSSLILAGQNDRAEQAIRTLGGLLRRSLETDALTPVPLSEELELADLFLDIERLRFPDRLDVVMDIDPETLSAPTPPLILQPLVENAVKYGAASAKSTQLTISSKRVDNAVSITVTNAVPSRIVMAGTGIGLKNVRWRLKCLYGDQAKVDIQETSETFEVRLIFPMALPSN